MKHKGIIFIYLFCFLFNCQFLFTQNLILEVEGENENETKIIDSFQSNFKFKDYNSLEKELDSLYGKLQKEGYIESEIISIDKKNDSIFRAKLNLNNKYNTIYIYHNNLIPEKDLQDVSSEVSSDYLKITFTQAESVLGKLNNKLSSVGDPFLKLKLNNIRKKDSNSLFADLEIISSKKRTIDNIIIKGYRKFPKSFLKRFLKIKTGTIFNLQDIKSKTQVLNNISFANQIREPEVLFTKDSTTLYLYLEKKNTNTFDGFLGFGNTEASNKIRFNGYLNLNLTNNLNRGESLKFIYKSDENEQRTIDISTQFPYLLKTPLGLELSLNLFKKDSTFSSSKQLAKLFYQFNNNTRIISGIELEKSNSLDNNLNQSFIEDYKSTFYSIALEYKNMTNRVLFPIQSYVQLGTNIGNRIYDNSSENQNSLFFRVHKIFNLNNNNSIYINSDGKMLFSDNYLINELYRFGGINSIRGFEENSLFASLFSTLNTEYRILLNDKIYIHSITDAAYYENKITNLKEKLFGFGFGFGIITKGGLLKLNYANGLTQNQPFKFRNSKIHISLNTTF